jgi:hypothetical protein
LRPPREAYARAVVQCGQLDVVAGLEYRHGDRFVHLRDELRSLLRHVSMCLGDRADEELLAKGVEMAIRGRWPERAYFIECGDDEDGWIQIFQPFGVPRNWDQ